MTKANGVNLCFGREIEVDSPRNDVNSFRVEAEPHAGITGKCARAHHLVGITPSQIYSPLEKTTAPSGAVLRVVEKCQVVHGHHQRRGGGWHRHACGVDHINRADQTVDRRKPRRVPRSVERRPGNGELPNGHGRPEGRMWWASVACGDAYEGVAIKRNERFHRPESRRGRSPGYPVPTLFERHCHAHERRVSHAEH